MGAVAMEAMPHQKGLGNPRSPSSSYSPTRNFKKSPGFILRNPRSHRDLPVRLNHKLLKRSSDDDLTPPPSPKRAHSGSGGRLSKLSKRDENDVPAHFKGLKPTEHCGLEKAAEIGSLKRPREPAAADDFYSKRMKLQKLDDANIDEHTRKVQASNWASIIEQQKQKANNIKPDLTRMLPDLQRGFENFTGVLCYRISLIQSLLHIHKLVTLLWDFHGPSVCVVDNPQDCSACHLRRLIIAYWKYPEGKVLATMFQRLHSLLKRRGWTENGQADPNEQLTFIFRILREDMPVATYTDIESIFSSSINQRIPCACGHASTTTSSQTQMTVCLAPQLRNGTLQQYIARGITDTVDYQCEACKKTRQCKKTRLFDDLSEILAIHLSRLDNRGRKIKTTITVPNTLDLTLLKSKSSTDTERWKYELISIIQHSGGDESGHYICSAEGPDGRWRMFNDRSVSKCVIGAVGKSFSPVMCFYRRIR